MERQTISDNARPYSQINKGYESLAQANTDGIYKLSVLVGGAHCAACIQKIEASIRRHSEVQYARLNFSNGLLSMEWNGNPEIANDLVEGVEKYGYSVHPYDFGKEKEILDSEERVLLLCRGVAAFSM